MKYHNPKEPGSKFETLAEAKGKKATKAAPKAKAKAAPKAKAKAE